MMVDAVRPWMDLPPVGEPYYQVVVDVHELTTMAELQFLNCVRSLAGSLSVQSGMFDPQWVPMLLGGYPLRYDLVEGRIQLLRVGVACVLAVMRLEVFFAQVSWHRVTDVPMVFVANDIRRRIHLLNELLIDTVYRWFENERSGRESGVRLSLVVEQRLRELRDLRSIPGLDGPVVGRPQGEPTEQERAGEYACWGFGFVEKSHICQPCPYAMSCAPACQPVRGKKK